MRLDTIVRMLDGGAKSGGEMERDSLGELRTAVLAMARVVQPGLNVRKACHCLSPKRRTGACAFFSQGGPFFLALFLLNLSILPGCALLYLSMS